MALKSPLMLVAISGRSVASEGRRRSHFLAALLALSPLAGCENDPLASAPSGTIVIDDVDISPVVALDGQPFVLSLSLRNASGPVVSFIATDFSGTGADRFRITVYDDGTHGDARAGDGIYTTNALALPAGDEGVASTAITHLTNVAGPNDGPLRVYMVKGAFRSIDPAADTPPIHELASDARATSRVVALVHPGAKRMGDHVAEITRRYYELLPDDRDFLVLISAAARSGPTYSGRATHVRQAVRNIGLNQVARDGYGSEERLQLIVEIVTNIHDSGKPDGFCLVTHELNHRWAAFLGAPLAAQAHWADNALLRDASAFGRAGTCKMNDLELYLAGLLAADSVQAPLTADGFTMADVLGRLGHREPAVGDAPADFTIGFVVVNDRPLLDHEMAYFDRLAREYTSEHSGLGNTWLDVTGGRSRLDASLNLPTQ